MRCLFSASILALAVLTGCLHSGGSSHGANPNPRSDSGDPGTPATVSEKRALIQLMNRYYLWPDPLPANPDLVAARTLPDLMKQLTAEANRQGLDRGWSQLVRGDLQFSAVHGNGVVAAQALNYGLGAALVQRGGQAFVSYVLAGSDPARQGVARGDEVLAAAATRKALDRPESQVARLLAPDDAARAAAAALFGEQGPATIHVRIRKPGAPAALDLAVAKTYHSSDLVPEANRAEVLHQDGGQRVGYLQLRVFRSEADDLLRQACARLQAEGVTDLIVDLRYNGGGLGNTAALLVNLLRGEAQATDVMWRTTYSKRPSVTTWFTPWPESLRLRRIAFIVTGDTASSSEMVVNTLAPYLRADLALIGSRTYGKPVGMEVLNLPGTSWTVLPVSVQNLNADGFSHYFQGLPDPHFRGTAWAAEDDLAHPQGDPAEASTATALRWIRGETANLTPIPLVASIQACEARVESARADASPVPLPYRGQDPDRPGLF
jgi:carboxyl-terminal processing protease